jgi:cytochrome c-type biogenesis protein CcmE
MSNERKRRRLVVVVALAVTAGTLAFLAFGNIGESLVYYWSPTELLAAGERGVGASVRLGGLVATDSIVLGEDGLALHFQVTDGENAVPVEAHAVPPAMFREGIGVVVEGTMRPDGVFDTKRLMIKHDNEYQAPGEGELKDMKELMRTMQFEEEDA